MSAPSFDNLYEIAKAELLLRRPDLALNEGDVSDFIVAAGAAMADKAVSFAVAEAKATYIDGATGDQLTTLAEDHYNITRQLPTSATGYVTFSRSTVVNGAGTIPTGTSVGTDFNTQGERVEFTTDSDAVFGALDTSITVGITAINTGSESNIEATKVSNVVDSIFDTNITVTNVDAIAGGNPQESDDQLRSRVRNFNSTLRRGTLAALEYGALQVGTVRNATATEDVATGLVQVFVSDDAGSSNLEMVSDVTAELENWRCAGTALTVVGGVLANVNVDVVLTVRAGTDISALTVPVTDAITAEMEKLKVADVLYDSIIISAVRNLDSTNIRDVTVTFTSSDATIDSTGTEATPPVGGLIRVGSVSVS